MKRKLPGWWLKWAITADEVWTRVEQSFSALPSSCTSARPLRLSDLEPRLLFSATPIDVAGLAGADGSSVAATVEISENSVNAQAAPSSIATLAVASAEQQPSEIVFVDSAVPELQQLLDGLDRSGRNIEVFVFDTNRDGIEQITEALNSRSDISSIHIVSHARDGAVRLGNTWLSEDNLAGYAGQLASWQNSLSSNADLLFYGCDLASGDDGRTLLEAFSTLTGADVAASIDDTGSASLGGDWELEYRYGSIETKTVFTADVQADWNELLAAPTLSVRQEFLVNTTTAGNQSTVGSQQAVAADGSGNYIVVWSDDGADGDGWGVFAQRFDSNGNALGSEFQVNVNSVGDQKDASVAMNASGQFVVTFVNESGANKGIWMRRFAADGAAMDASDVYVNVGNVGGNQHSPTVAINASAQVVITWESAGTFKGIYAQAFDFTTTTSSNNISTGVITIETGADATAPSVAINDSGRYVVAWEQGGDVYARRYNHGSATALSTKQDMNQLSDGSQSGVGIRADGSYVVTFRSSSFGLYFRAANADGSLNGSSVSVTSATSAQAPTISMDSSGAFIVAYQNSDPSGQGVYARKFFSNNGANGSEFRINTSTDSDQQAVSIATLDGANFVAVWSGKGTQTNNVDTSGVFAMQFGTAIAHTISVNTTSDSSDGDTSSIDALLNNRGADGMISLREAIIAANNTLNGTLPDHIHFNIIGSGSHTIGLLSALPTITGAVIIDGTSQFDYAGSPLIVLNGTSAGGTTDGIQLSTNSGGSTIRGLVIQEFSGQGILIESSNNLIVGNFIGTGADGTTSLGNAGNGIWIKDDAADNTVGGTATTDRNVIAGNLANGILVSGSQATGNKLVGNRITANGGLGIALDSGAVNSNDYLDADSGANAGQNYPTITMAEVRGTDLFVAGTLGTSPNATFSLDFYSNSISDGSLHGEAAVYLGSTSVTTDADGNGTFSLTLFGVNVTAGQHITATATDSSNNTSEFAQNYAAAVPNRDPVADAGGPYSIDEGSSLAINASGSSDPDSDTLTYQWDLDGDSIFGEAGEPSTAIATVTWATLVGLGVTSEGAHTIRVQVNDGRGKSDIQTTTFSISNVAPTFTSSTAVSVNENQVVVQTVSASDPVDTLTYSITGGVDAEFFDIIGSTGALSFKAAPNFESPQDHGANNSYIVEVTAHDGTTTTSQLVTVSINDVNEAPSDITLSNATLAENADGAVIGNVAVVDPDTGDSHAWTVDDARFEIVGNQWKLKAGQSLDHETEPTLNLKLTATDQAGAGIAYAESFTISVSNVNEAPSDITLSNTTVVEEAVGAVIGNVAAVDPDAGDSHTWTVDDARFEIVGNQLKLKSGQSLDYETEPTLNLRLTATDQAGAGYANSQSFTISVAAINEAPTNVTLSNSTVQGNSPGATVGSLVVADPDVGDTHTWAVNDSRFTVVDGVLKLKPEQRLASHVEPTVDVTVTAIDASGMRFSKTFTIVVKAPQVITPVSPTNPSNNTSPSNTSSSDGDNATAVDSGGTKSRDTGGKASKDGDAGNQADAGAGSGNNVVNGQLGVMQGMASQSVAQGAPSAAPVVLVLSSSESSEDEVAGADEALGNVSNASTHGYAYDSASTAKMTSDERFSTELRHLGATGLNSLALQANYAMMTRPGEMWQELDHYKQQVESQIQGDLIVVGTAGAAASSVTVGIIAWGLRTGFLASGLLAQLPAWRSIDPLLIMQGAGQGDNESLEELMKRRSDALDEGESADETMDT